MLYLLLRALSKGYSLTNIRWLYRQWNNESGFSSSNLFRQNNNPFGMSAVYVRPTTQSGWVSLPDGNTNGVYPSIKKAIDDRFLWDKFMKMNPSSDSYPYEVSEKYNPNSSYYSNVNNTDDKGFRRDFLLLLLPLPLTAFFIFKTIKYIL